MASSKSQTEFWRYCIGQTSTQYIMFRRADTHCSIKILITFPNNTWKTFNPENDRFEWTCLESLMSKFSGIVDFHSRHSWLIYWVSLRYFLKTLNGIILSSYPIATGPNDLSFCEDCFKVIFIKWTALEVDFLKRTRKGNVLKVL